jgi:hypothetical protein
MVRSVTGFMAAAFILVALTGCYGISTSTECQVCKDLQEGKSEGNEWTGEYIHDKFQCKLEGGKLMVEHGEEWKVCD